jgi:hypothetical protein
MRLAALFVLTLAAAGCQSPEDQLEETVRNLLSDRGNVQEVELAQGEDGNMTGHAMVAEANGQTSRFSCSATKAGETKAGEETRFNITCVPPIGEQMLQAVEADIRGYYEERGAEIVEVDMQRHNDDRNMRGFVQGRDATGDVRLSCTAQLDTANNRFPWQCVPDGQAAGAPAGDDAGGK